MSITEIEQFRFGLRKELDSDHFPITIVNGLDVILAANGYSRLEKKPDEDMFIWENTEQERYVLDYYTRVNGLSHSRRLSVRNFHDEETQARLDKILSGLMSTIGTLNQQVGYPYIKTSRSLTMEICSHNPREKVDLIIPVMRKLYLEKENLNVVTVDVMDQSEDCVNILFAPISLTDE